MSNLCLLPLLFYGCETFQGARGLALYAGIAQRNGLVPIIGNQRQRLGTLQRHNNENLKQIFPEKKLPAPVPIPNSCVCERFKYSHDRSAYSVARKYVDWSWEFISPSQTHECGNWDWSRAIPFLRIYKWDFHCSVLRYTVVSKVSKFNVANPFSERNF
jgi:hypothetical protein